MKKVTYGVSSLYSSKQLDDSIYHARSYPYVTKSNIRGAILNSVILLDGINKAKELFPIIQDASIFVTFPKQFITTTQLIKRRTNSFYSKSNKENKSEEHFTTIGDREYIDLDEIVFYIDDSIPNIDIYLNHIYALGNSESLVHLISIHNDIKEMHDVLVEWDEKRDGDQELFEVPDWGKSMVFENVYMYSNKRNKKFYEKSLCFMKNIKLV